MICVQAETAMEPRLRHRVAELMSERGWSPTDLMRRSLLSYGTCLQLSKDPDKEITKTTLLRLCIAFGVGPDKILVYETPPGK